MMEAVNVVEVSKKRAILNYEEIIGRGSRRNDERPVNPKRTGGSVICDRVSSVMDRIV